MSVSFLVLGLLKKNGCRNNSVKISCVLPMLLPAAWESWPQCPKARWMVWCCSTWQHARAGPQMIYGQCKCFLCKPMQAWVQSTWCFSLGWLNTSLIPEGALNTLMIKYQVRTGPEMKSVKMHSCLERVAGVIQGCDCGIRASWKEKCDDFCSENNNGHFGRMLCIIPQAGVLPGHRNFSAWMQWCTGGVGSWLSLKLAPKLHPGFSHKCDPVSSCSSVHQYLPVVTHLSLTLEMPWGWCPLFVQVLCSLLHNEPCGNMGKQLLRVKDLQVTDGKTSPQDWLCNRITTTNS